MNDRASRVLRWLFAGTDDLRVPGPVRDAVAFAERDERIAHYGLRLARRVRAFHESSEPGVGYEAMMQAMVDVERAADGPVPRRHPVVEEIIDIEEALRRIRPPVEDA